MWNVAADDATAAMEAAAVGSVPWGTLFWVPLMTGGNNPAAIARWREIVTQTITSNRTRGNLGVVAMVFAELAGRQPEWARELEGFDMTESQVANEWIGQGETKGRLAERRQTLLELLNDRFPGAIPAEVTQLVQTQESLELLRDWTRAAGRALSFDQFMEALKKWSHHHFGGWRSTRPPTSSLYAPSAIATCPFTSTHFTPAAYWCGLSNVAVSRNVFGSNTTRSAKYPGFR